MRRPATHAVARLCYETKWGTVPFYCEAGGCEEGGVSESGVVVTPVSSAVTYDDLLEVATNLR